MKRLYPKHPLAGVGVVIIYNGKILLEKRRKEPGKGKWSIPGGLLELGENLEQAVIREVEEETSLKVEKPELLDVVDNIIRDENGRTKYHFVTIIYFAKLKSGKLKAADDAAQLTWVTLKKVEDYDLSKRFRDFFKNNRHKLGKLNSCP